MTLNDVSIAIVFLRLVAIARKKMTLKGVIASIFLHFVSIARKRREFIIVYF